MINVNLIINLIAIIFIIIIIIIIIINLYVITVIIIKVKITVFIIIKANRYFINVFIITIIKFVFKFRKVNFKFIRDIFRCLTIKIVGVISRLVRLKGIIKLRSYFKIQFPPQNNLECPVRIKLNHFPIMLKIISFFN
jgi:hypothetical protein